MSTTDAATCARCGVLAFCELIDGSLVCAACVEAERPAPAPERLRLFTPAPEQMPGQEGWEL